MVIRILDISHKFVISSKMSFRGLHLNYKTDKSYIELSAEFANICYALNNKKPKPRGKTLLKLLNNRDKLLYRRHIFLIKNILVDKKEAYPVFPNNLDKENIKIFLIKWKPVIYYFYSLYKDTVEFEYPLMEENHPIYVIYLIYKENHLKLNEYIQRSITHHYFMPIAQMFALYTNKKFLQEDETNDYDSIYTFIQSYLKYDFK